MVNLGAFADYLEPQRHFYGRSARSCISDTNSGGGVECFSPTLAMLR